MNNVISVNALEHTKKSARLRSTNFAMALVAGYSSDEDEGIAEPSVPLQSTSKPAPSRSVQAAPEVSLEVS